MNTNTIITLNGVHYCAFCGMPIMPDDYFQFLCHCEDAVNYRKAIHDKLRLELQAAEIMKNAPKPKFHTVTLIAPINEQTTSQPDDTDSVPSNPL